MTHVFGRPLTELDSIIESGNVVPKHGSGATADRKIGNDKWRFTEWHERLETLFPYVDYALPSYSYWEHSMDVRFLSPSEERPSKMVAVPKTHSTPRLIAEEPTCMQYMQQAILMPLVALLEDKRSISNWFVGFSEQWPNQALAQIGSEDGSLATLDLSEASDRVGNWLVEVLFENFPWLSEAVQATRSRSIELPSGEIVQLRKFASMGSALTFPIEAMVFTSIVIEAVLRSQGKPITTRSIKALRDMVRVYGDDIIVPTHSAESVIESLEAFGLKVNRHKSFWNGEFRESCGKEFWKGHDVSIVRFRRAAPESRRDVEGIVSWVATRNLFSDDEMYPETVSLLDEFLEGLLGHFPWVRPTSTLLGRTRTDGFYQVDGIRGRYQAPFAEGWTVRHVLRQQELSDHHALLKCLLTTIGNSNVDEKHLQRGGRPIGASIIRSKAQPF